MPPERIFPIRGIVLDDVGTVIPFFQLTATHASDRGRSAHLVKGREGAFALDLTQGSWSLLRDGPRLASSFETTDVRGGFTLTMIPGTHDLFAGGHGAADDEPARLLEGLEIGKNDTLTDVELVVR